MKNTARLILFLLVIPTLTFAIGNTLRTINTEIITSKNANQSITITPTGTGNVILKDYTGFINWASGVPTVQSKIGLTTDISGILPIANGGTGSATQNFVDLTTAQSIAGLKSFSGQLLATSTTQGSRPCPPMTQAEIDAITGETLGDCVYNETTFAPNYWDGIEWIEISGGGAGGSRTNLPSFPSFEDDTEGTCVNCTTAQETTIVMETPNNLNSLKITTSAINATYTLDVATSTQWHEGMQLIKWFWIKTAEQGVRIVSRSNSTNSTTVIADVIGDSKWRPYRLYDVAGLTNNGYQITMPESGDIVYLDEIEIRPSNSSDMSSVASSDTDWKTYSLTIDGATTAPTKSSTVDSDSAQWRRVGDSMQVRYAYKHSTNTGAASGTGAYIFKLPSGYSIDTTKFEDITGTGGISSVGSATGFGSATGTVIGSVSVSPSADGFYLTVGDETSSPAAVSATFVQLNQAFVQYSFMATVPIVGWGSSISTIVSQETEVQMPVVEGYQTFSTTGIFSGFSPNVASATGQYARVGNRVRGWIEAQFGATQTSGASMSITLPWGVDASAFVSAQTKRINFGKVKVAISGSRFNGTLVRDTTVDGDNSFVIAMGGTAATVSADTTWTYNSVATINSGDGFRVDFDYPVKGWTATESIPKTIIGNFENINSTPLAVVKANSNSGQTITALTDDMIWSTETEDDQNLWNGSQFTAPRTADYTATIGARTTTSLQGQLRVYINGISANIHISPNSAAIIQTYKFARIALNEGDVLSFRRDGTATLEIDSSYHHIVIEEMPDTESIVKNLLAEASQTKCQTKYLSANVGTNGAMADLTFNNLEIGKKYSVYSHTRYYIPTAVDTIDISVSDGTLRCYQIQSLTTVGNIAVNSCLGEFWAAGTAITTSVGDLTAGNLIQGTNNVAGTHVRLCQLPDTHVNTTEL